MKNIYKIFFLITYFSICMSPACFSQVAAPVIQWQNTIGGAENDDLFSIQQTTDGGYILAGTSKSDSSGDKTENSIGSYDYWMVKTDSSGTVQWENTIGGANFDELLVVQQTSDGGFMFGGTSNSDYSIDKTEYCHGQDDYWIIKTDAFGIFQWQNTIGGTYYDHLYSVKQTSDGGYILGGMSSSPASFDKTENFIGSTQYPDFWIVKTDAAGNVQWDNTIGGFGSDAVSSIRQTSDGGYIIGGNSDSPLSGDKTEYPIGGGDYWIVKTDSAGMVQWQNTIGGTLQDELKDIIQTADGGYILAGVSRSDNSGDKTENCIGGYDYWIVKTDAAGNVQWDNTIGGTLDDALWSFHLTSDGGYIIAGWSTSGISGDKTENSNGNTDYWVVKIDSAGIIQWQNTIGGTLSDLLFDAEPTSDGGYILGGLSTSGIGGDKTENSVGDSDYWIVKLIPDTMTGIQNMQTSNFNFQTAPNPAHNFININYTLSSPLPATISLFNIYGQKLKSILIQHQITGAHEIKVDLKDVVAGIYFVKFSAGGREEVKKVVIE